MVAEVERLARKIATEMTGTANDATMLERARAVAQAELELARVQQAKTALIERFHAFGSTESPRLSARQAIRIWKAFERGRLLMLEPIDPLATIPLEEPQRSAEAVRRALPDLLKIDRYARRAAARRDRAVRGLLRLRREHNQKHQICETNPI
jgi:hypothetical protein